MSHYFVNDPSLKSELKSFDYKFADENFTFVTDKGVFSKDYIDYGSFLLLKNTYLLSLGGKILDLGCGYGPIGIIIKHFHPEAEVDAVDVNTRAVALCAQNARDNAADISVYKADDIILLNKTYNSILLNPPIHSGKELIFSLYEKSWKILEENGSLYIVIKKQHGALSSQRKLKELFNEVDLLAKEAGYWLFRAQR